MSNQVWIVDLPSAAERQLTTDEFFKSNLAWLLDGSRLAYAWYRNPDPYHDTLTTILADGTDPRDLGPVQTIYDPPALSPDGRTIAYGGDGGEEGSSGIVLLDLATGTRRTLTNDGAVAPAWSPDGTKIVAALYSRRVLVFDVATGATLASIEDPGTQGVLGWTADGSAVIYEGCGDTKDSCGPWTALADGTGKRPYDGPLPDANPGWLSPDRQWRATVRDDPDLPGVSSLFVGQASGGTAVRLTGTLIVGSVSWSPDSQWLAFGGSPVGDAGSARIYLVNRAGGVPVPVTAGPLDEAPAWQPAGS